MSSPPLLDRALARVLVVGSVLSVVSAAAACDYVDTPYTYVVLDNDYPASATPPLVVYDAYWEATFFSSPTPPGSSSLPAPTVASSGNTAWAVLAPGWDPSSAARPTSFVLLESRTGFAVALNDTLHIPVDDTSFAGNCAAGSFLSQSDADFITQLVFPCTFAGLHYDAATCKTTPLDDAGVDGACADDAGAR